MAALAECGGCCGDEGAARSGLGAIRNGVGTAWELRGAALRRARWGGHRGSVEGRVGAEWG